MECDQPTLFDRPDPAIAQTPMRNRRSGHDVTSNRHGGADTSVNAAESVPASVRGNQRHAIYAAIRQAGAAGLTCDECEMALDKTHQSTSSRISELARDGFIIDSGRRRKTRSGVNARVMVAAATPQTANSGKASSSAKCVQCDKPGCDNPAVAVGTQGRFCADH